MSADGAVNSGPPPPDTSQPTRRRPRDRRPPLIRLAARVRLGGTIVFAILIVLLATIAYSAFSLGVTNPSGQPNHTSLGRDVVTLTSYLNLTNGGLYPISGLTFEVVAYESGGPVVGKTVGAPVTVGIGAKYQLPIVISVQTGAGTPGQQLLVRPATLEAEGWLNATFGYILSVSVGVSPSGGTSWEPPFEAFSVKETGSGTSATVTVTFTDATTVPVVGTMSVALLDSSQATCGTAAVSVNAPPQGSAPYSASGTATLKEGCTPVSALATISGPAPVPFSFTLPQVSV